MSDDLQFGRSMVEFDWLYTAKSERLHHATLTDEQYVELAENSQLEETSIQLTCGRAVWWPSIPGLFSRMGMPRCERCCDRLGYPRGVGSPKNDPRCDVVPRITTQGGGS